MRKQGSLDGIILLVISFSVINYVVSRASACEGRRFFFYVSLLTNIILNISVIIEIPCEEKHRGAQLINWY